MAPTILARDRETRSVPDSARDLPEYLSGPVWWYPSQIPVPVDGSRRAHRNLMPVPGSGQWNENPRRIGGDRIAVIEKVVFGSPESEFASLLRPILRQVRRDRQLLGG